MNKILQLKIELDGIEPKIWRRFLVEEDISFEDLHDIIQIVMGWENYHFYKFCIGNETIACDEEGYNPAEKSLHNISKSPEFIKIVEEKDMSKGSAFLDVNKILKNMEKNKPKNSFGINTTINKLITSEKQEFHYHYDFGDNWEHTIVVEKIFNSEESQNYPSCLDGERACPPEDCGSIDGYYELLSLKENKKHPDYKERIIEWLGEDHDFEYFDVNEINEELREENDFWEDNDFFETLDPQDSDEKMKTFYKKHDEDMNYNCKKCNKKISAHNKDWHNGMCDECSKNYTKNFNEEDFNMPMDFDKYPVEAMTNSLVEEAFPDIWQERKKELKEMAKKELAKEMFGAGAYISINNFMHALKNESKKHRQKRGTNF